ncbi:MAG: PhnD/SsuA/transferrin family substrate-binding protein [Phycisphaerales bacterium]|nr:PhnD/SsuA/transferrin family substrate-binding protein [Phycisphaerales bacterium]
MHSPRLGTARPDRVRWELLAAGLAPLLLLTVGCQSQSRDFSLWNPFGLKLPFSFDQPPVRIGMVMDSQGVLDPQRWFDAFRTAPWEPMSKQLSDELRQPVQFEPLTADQIAFHLQSGRLHFALVSGDSLQKIREKNPDVVELAAAEISTRRGVIVTDADSGLRAFADLKGHRFAFGPADDPILDKAAKACLAANGVALEDLKREILPIPGTLQYHISSFDAAREIVYGGTPAGVMDAEEFAALPESGGRFTWKGFTFSRDQFNVVGYTEPIAVDTIEDARFVASHTVAEPLRESVRAFLLNLGSKHPAAAEAMGFKGFHAVEVTHAEDVARSADAEFMRPADALEAPQVPQQRSRARFVLASREQLAVGWGQPVLLFLFPAGIVREIAWEGEPGYFRAVWQGLGIWRTNVIAMLVWAPSGRRTVGWYNVSVQMDSGERCTAKHLGGNLLQVLVCSYCDMPGTYDPELTVF